MKACKTDPPPCECPVADYCERHRRDKSEHQRQLCIHRSDYRALWDRLAAGIKPATLLQRARKYQAARKRWKAAGKPVRPPAEMARVFAICQACPLFQRKDESSGVCGKCRCGLKAIGTRFNKIAWGTESCPDVPPRWSAVDNSGQNAK